MGRPQTTGDPFQLIYKINQSLMSVGCKTWRITQGKTRGVLDAFKAILCGYATYSRILWSSPGTGSHRELWIVLCTLLVYFVHAT